MPSNNTPKSAASDISEQVRAYWERRSCGTDVAESQQYSLQYFEEIEESRYKIEPFIHSFAQFTRAHGKRVLEVGVGAGTDFLQWVRAGAEAHGVDLTTEAIRNVENRLRLYGLTASDLQNLNAEHLPYADNTFDIVYSWGVIHHADNMEQVFREIYRVARPGARIKIMVYNYRSLYAWLMAARYGLWRGKGRRWAVYHYQESYATKLYSVKDVVRLVRSVEGDGLSIQLWNQKIRRGARFGSIRQLVEFVTPEWMRWYLAFEFTKLGAAESVSAHEV